MGHCKWLDMIIQSNFMDLNHGRFIKLIFMMIMKLFLFLLFCLITLSVFYLLNHDISVVLRRVVYIIVYGIVGYKGQTCYDVCSIVRDRS